MSRFTFDGREIPYKPGDTIGSALHRADVKVISRSLRYHRPRGLYCCTGSCASCFVDVDGTPNVPACMRMAGDGAKVTSQNRIGSAQHDLLGVVDKVYRTGFDPHDAYTKSRVLNRIFNVGVRFLSGLGKAPPPETRLEGPRRHTVHVDELIIGAGLHGLRRARDASKEGRKVLLVDEMPGLGGSARWDPADHESRLLAQQAPHWSGVEAWTDALCFGLYPHERKDKPPIAAIRRRDTAGSFHPGDLWEVNADRISVAPGRHDAWPIFDNNDLPGVLSLRGAMRLLGEHKVLPGRTIVGHGEALPKAFVAKLQDLDGHMVAQGTVEAARGGSQVTGARIKGAWVDCDAIVCNIPGTPRAELFQQAGCKLGFPRGVLEPITLPSSDGKRSASANYGETTKPGVFALLGGVS